MKCETCYSYDPQNGAQGLCRLIPPSPMLAGMMQAPGGLANLPRQQPQPLILSAHPTVKATDWCRQHQPAAFHQPPSEDDAKPVQPDAIEAMRKAVDELGNFTPNKGSSDQSDG